MLCVIDRLIKLAHNNMSLSFGLCALAFLVWVLRPDYTDVLPYDVITYI